MKFNKIRLVGVSNVDFPIIGADPDGPFVLKGADGLGPTERAIFRAQTIQEGGFRQGVRAADRQTTLLVGLQPDWDTGQTADELRDDLYGLLTPPFGQPTKMQLMLGSDVIAVAQGDVSKMEPAIFSKDPAVQIVLDCDYPYLMAPAIKYQTPTKGLISGQTYFDVDNDGTAPAGFWLQIAMTTGSGTLTISDNAANGQSMSIAGPWESGDILKIDTRAGQRGVWRKASGSGAFSSKLNDLAAGSSWLQLHKGDNRLLVNRTSFNWEGNGFGHTPAYSGV